MLHEGKFNPGIPQVHFQCTAFSIFICTSWIWTISYPFFWLISSRSLLCFFLILSFSQIDSSFDPTLSFLVKPHSITVEMIAYPDQDSCQLSPISVLSNFCIMQEIIKSHFIGFCWFCPIFVYRRKQKPFVLKNLMGSIYNLGAFRKITSDKRCRVTKVSWSYHMRWT